MDISERIRNLRHASGMTQSELAHELFVTRQAVSKWESGKGTPDIFNLLAMTRIFSVSLDHLVDNQDSKSGETYDFKCMEIDRAVLDKYKPHGSPLGSKSHRAAIQIHPTATIWSLSRVAKNNRTQETLEWILAFAFDTPFGVFSIADYFSDRSAYYLAQETGSEFLVKVSKTAAESMRLKDRPETKTFTVGKDVFRIGGKII